MVFPRLGWRCNLVRALRLGSWIDISQVRVIGAEHIPGRFVCNFRTDFDCGIPRWPACHGISTRSVLLTSDRPLVRICTVDAYSQTCGCACGDRQIEEAC